MYAIRENKRVLNDGTEITTFSRDIKGSNLVQIEAGTSGFKGGDTDIGGRTYFRIENKGATDITTQRISPASAGGGFYLTKQSEYNLRLFGQRFCESPLLVKSRALKCLYQK